MSDLHDYFSCCPPACGSSAYQRPVGWYSGILCSFQKLCALCPSELQLLILSNPVLTKDDLIYNIKDLCYNAELIWALAVSVFLLVRMVTG